MNSFLPLARWVGALLCLLVGLFGQTQAAPLASRSLLAPRASSDGQLVFAHFMVGIVANRQTAADWDDDMLRAKEVGIDAFALNIGLDSYTSKQLDLAYESAANNGIKLFISFDFNWWSPGDAASVGQMIAKYASKPAQLIVNGKVFASSFIGDGLNVKAMRAAAGVPVFWAPNFSPSKTPDPSDIDGALNWMGWDSNGMNKAPSGNRMVKVEDGDSAYRNWLGGKPYMMAASPWFNTHYGSEVSYSKNWVFPSDLLWFNRWTEILATKPKYVEIVTFNDYGESHYVGPLSSKHHDDGNSKWVNDMPHDGWLDMAKPFIEAFHAGADKVDDFIKEDQIIYWYRPNTKSVNCDATDTTMGPANNASGDYFSGRPGGFDTMEDAVFVISLLTEPGSISVTSGDKGTVTYNAPAGAYAQQVPMGVGKQAFELSRGGKSVLSGASLKDVTAECIYGIYNYNAYVGQLPFKGFGSLDSDGHAQLTSGLKVNNVSPAPTLNGQVAGGPAPAPTKVAAFNPPSPPASAPAPADAAPASPASPNLPSSLNENTPLSDCNGGTASEDVSGNFIGLCEFACAQGYCPPGVCKCTSTGAPSFTVQSSQAPGCPLPGASDGYKGLCAFSCAHGYCPDTACQPSC